MKEKKVVLIFNPKSGKGKATLRAKDFADKWRERTGKELTLRATRSLIDIRVAAKETLPEHDVQIFMGGDGTLSESLQGLAEYRNFALLEKPVGFLPGGTGNSFLRDFGITNYEQAREALLSALLRDETISVDTAHVKYRQVQEEHPSEPGSEHKRIFFNIWGVGLISDITETAVKMRGIGEMNYKLAALARIGKHKMYRNRMQINGREWEELDYNFISLSNSRYTGGAMKIAPDVRVNDGKLFFLRTAIPSRLKLLSEFPKVFKGGHTSIPNAYTELIRTFAIEGSRPFVMNVDGELEIGWNPVVTLVDHYFHLYMPKSHCRFDES